jgi:3-oxoacyl-[acyl-carrier-protein] synthase-1
MRESFFVGAALHTHVADSYAAHLPLLPQALNRVDRATLHYAGVTERLPYKLLYGPTREELLTRAEDVLCRVVGEALDVAGLTAQQRRRCGLFLGSSSFDIGSTEAHYRQELIERPDALAMRHSSSQGMLAVLLRQRFNLGGADFSFNTACTASANALCYADAMVRNGDLDHALVVGVEICNAITALGFKGLQLLTPTAMRPFSPERNGLVLGEGCAALVLSSTRTEHGNLDPMWRLIGSSNLCDTHSISAANPDGSTVAQVITAALAQAALTPSQITAIKTHGTASLLNDEAEAAGLHRVFADMPPLTALKPYLGHTLGACGLIELLLFCAAADQRQLPATPGIGTGDDRLKIALNQTTTELPPGRFLLNYFGFGGNNTTLIVANDGRSP